jgi:hypothetical protein
VEAVAVRRKMGKEMISILSKLRALQVFYNVDVNGYSV